MWAIVRNSVRRAPGGGLRPNACRVRSLTRHYTVAEEQRPYKKERQEPLSHRVRDHDVLQAATV